MRNSVASPCIRLRRIDSHLTPDLNIYRSARLPVKQHGEEAPIHAAMRADATLEAGDVDAYAVWKRILRAVEELQEVEPGTRVH